MGDNNQKTSKNDNTETGAHGPQDNAMPNSKLRKQESVFKMHPKYKLEDFVAKFRDSWANNSAHCDAKNGVELRVSPFKLCTLQDFVSEEGGIEKLMNEIVNEVEWKRLHTDFLEFHQSPDLSSVISDYLREFYKYLREEVMSWMERLTGEKLNNVSASCSLYNTGDRLLIHNDCVSDRKIAYVFYLSPWEMVRTWSESMGGALELFKEDRDNMPNFPPIEKIFPRNNQFLFFHVNSKSWHQVGEVLSFDYPRVTINGWFHGPGKKHPIVESSSNWDASIQNPAIGKPFELSEWINGEYLEMGTKSTIQKYIEEHSQISLHKFLNPTKLTSIHEELKGNSNKCHWETKSSACERNCESLNLNSLDKLPENVARLIELLQSQEFFHLLYEYSELDFSGENAKSPKCFLEVQRWRPECYTMLVNAASEEANSGCKEGVLDAILYLNDFAEAGTYIYVAQKDGKDADQESAMSDEEDEDFEEEGPLIIQPKSGALNLVYRTADMARFGAYVSKHLKMGDEYVYIVVCSYKE